jgi:SAM-dependent methyltransferase
MHDAIRNPYDVYFASGSYDRRYPRPNPRVLAHVRRLVTPASHVIDFGCGSGRYLVPLRPHLGRAAGFDICETALGLLRERLTRGTGAPVDVLGPDPAMLSHHVGQHGKADLVLCLFGVLAHVTPRAARAEVLASLRGLLRPGGRLLVSVPNRQRRFAKEQREAAPGGEIRYRRAIAGGSICLPYQLFDPATLAGELADAGYEIEGVWAESVLPEAWLTGGGLAGALDAGLTALCPPRWGYGILMQAVSR